LTLGDGAIVQLEDLPERIRNHRVEPSLIRDPGEFVSLEEVERRYILQVFDAVSQNKSLAARILGLNRKTLYRKLREYGLLLDEPRSD
jgi:transcriptional regulator of acetoin/glycerol metabolism